MSTHTVAQESTTLRAPRLVPTGIAAALAAAVATPLVAAAAHGAGITMDDQGQPIPLLGFAQVTFLFALVGLALAAGVRRWAQHPRRTWVRTTVALTSLSFVPDLLADASTSTRLTLMTTHVVAALVVVPALARRLAD
jgi:hypothetical protein